MTQLRVTYERWPVRGQFRIARSTATESNVVVVELADGMHRGRGECEPHESDLRIANQVIDSIRALETVLARGMNREQLSSYLGAGPARNALDCALWDLEAKRQGRRAWELAGLTMRERVPTVYTLGIDTPAAMASKAAGARAWPQLKIKVGGGDGHDLDRVRAIRAARPDATLIVDANEAWTFTLLERFAPQLALLGVALIEQPLPRGGDDALRDYRGPVPLCADESCLDRNSLGHVLGRYAYINIKLDKTGGLTEALALAHSASEAGLGIMVGCMLGTSLAMAPALLVAQFARFIDLDGPVLLDKDRAPALSYEHGCVGLPAPELWG